MISKSQLYVLGQTGPWIGSMDRIHGSDPWIRSMDQIHGSDPWIWSQWVPRESQKGPKETQARPKGSQETPRHFATKTSKLAEAFDEHWSDRAQNSNAGTIFFENAEKLRVFFSTFCVGVEARAGHYHLPALNSVRTPKCKHCLGNNGHCFPP